MKTIVRGALATVLLITAGWFVMNMVSGGSVHLPGPQPAKWAQPKFYKYPGVKAHRTNHVVRIYVQASPTRKLLISWDIGFGEEGPVRVVTSKWSRKNTVRSGTLVAVTAGDDAAKGQFRCWIEVDGRVYEPPRGVEWDPYESADNRRWCNASVVVA